MSAAFQIVVLGCSGGPRENNLSGYLLSPMDKQQWVALDAGSLLGGIDRALEKNNLSGIPFNDSKLSSAGEMLVHHVKGFLLSHAHLDHILGLVINSQMDSKKNILGIDSTINNLRDHIFNGRIWPNYGSEGDDPVLGLYRYIRLPLHVQQQIPDTEMTVEAYLLSHPHGYPSTAFLIEHQERYLLYFGDTSSDFLEVEKHLARVWKRIAPLLKNGSFHGMMLECSFAHANADQVIYGHLDTRLMMREFHHLAAIAEVPLKGLKVLVTHRKESLKKGADSYLKIEQELTELNDLGIDFHFPQQGDRFTF